MASFQDSLKLLEEYGISFARTQIITCFEETKNFVSKNNFPVVLKKIPKNPSVHKKSSGLVITNIAGNNDLSKAFLKLSSKKVDGELVIQEQVKGVETIIGVKKDPVFGEVIMFGCGGVFAELFEDVSFRVCPLSVKDAESMIQEVKVFGILKKDKADVQALRKTLLKVSEMAMKEKIIEMDLNPFIVNEFGGVAVDVRII
ncbi:MAG: acetyl-CoA synthetase [Nanoarchaeota archaeon]|nr:acetyl-CoA synthetase [Nanoarchaeota archaeon]